MPDRSPAWSPSLNARFPLVAAPEKKTGTLAAQCTSSPAQSSSPPSWSPAWNHILRRRPGAPPGHLLSFRRAAMVFMGRRVGNYICSELYGSVMNQRLYSSRVDWKQLRPMILKRIKNRAKDYPIKRMIPVAEEVVRAREIVTEGVSMLLKVVPVHSCK